MNRNLKHLERKVNYGKTILEWTKDSTNSLLKVISELKLRESYKLIMCGDGAVGKTTFIRRILDKRIHSFYKLTIGVQFSTKDFHLSELFNFPNHLQTIRMQLWDLAGQSHFSQVRSQFYAGADVAIVMIDLSRPITYEVSDWLRELKVNTGRTDIPIVLVGNKLDLIDPNATKQLIPNIKRALSIIQNEMAYSLDRILFIATSVTEDINIIQTVKATILEILLWDNRELLENK